MSDQKDKKCSSYTECLNDSIEKVFSELLSRDEDPPETLVMLMCDSGGFDRDAVVAYLKDTRNYIHDWFDAHEGLIHYMVASRQQGGDHE